jgi:RNA polymerase sigma-B factor
MATSSPPKDEVADQFRAYRRSGDRVIRNALVEEHLGLADFYVKRYGGRGVASDDLRQVAFLAIVRAVERFDPEYGIEFSTFASRTIEGELKRYFRDRTWSVRPPRRAQELHLEVRRAEEDLHQRLGRSPTVAELADEVGETVDHVLEALEAGVAHSAASLDQPDPSDDTSPGPIAQRTLAQHELGFGTVESRMVIEHLLEKLPERERVVIEMRFFQNMTQPEIADEIGVSQSYLSRILRKALVELRGQLEA